MTADSRGQHEQTFPRKHTFTTILDIRSNRLIYCYKWWDGWPPHSRYKRLFMRRKYSLAHCEVPNKAPQRCGFLGTSAGAPGSKVRRDRVRPFCHHDVAHNSFRRWPTGQLHFINSSTFFMSSSKLSNSHRCNDRVRYRYSISSRETRGA